MMEKSETGKRGRGRPVTRATNLQALTVRLTPEAKTRLHVLAEIHGEHAYVLLEKFFWEHWEGLPAEEKKAAETIAATLEKSRRPLRSRR